MPIEPAAIVPSSPVSIAPDDARSLVVETLECPELQQYLHPEVLGRTPLRLVAEGLPTGALAGVEFFGVPLEVTPVDVARSSSKPFIELLLHSRGPDSVTVTFNYAVEGINGDVAFVRTGGTWRPGPVSIRER